MIKYSGICVPGAHWIRGLFYRAAGILDSSTVDPKRKFLTQCRVVDWGEKFDPLICRYPQIFKAHMFELTNQVMRTKEFADDPRWNAWNNVEDDVYHAMLQECPCGLVQPMKPYALSEAKKQDLEKSLSYVPVKEREYLMSMLHGAVGFDLMAAECFKDFNSNVLSTAQPVSVPLHFCTKAKHANVVPPQPNAKKTCSDARVSSSEIRDLLATRNMKISHCRTVFDTNFYIFTELSHFQ